MYKVKTSWETRYFYSEEVAKEFAKEDYTDEAEEITDEDENISAYYRLQYKRENEAWDEYDWKDEEMR